MPTSMPPGGPDGLPSWKLNMRLQLHNLKSLMSELEPSDGAERARTFAQETLDQFFNSPAITSVLPAPQQEELDRPERGRPFGLGIKSLLDRLLAPNTTSPQAPRAVQPDDDDDAERVELPADTQRNPTRMTASLGQSSEFPNPSLEHFSAESCERVGRVIPSEKDYQRVMDLRGCSTAHPDEEARVDFDTWARYVFVIKSAVRGWKPNNRKAVHECLRDLANPDTGGQHMVDLLLTSGGTQPQLSTVDLLRSLTTQEKEAYLDIVREYKSPTYLNIFNASREVTCGFTGVEGPGASAFNSLLLDLVTVLAAAGHVILVVVQGDERSEEMGWRLQLRMSKMGIQNGIDFTNRDRYITGSEVRNCQVLVGTPHCVNRKDVWTAFHPHIIFGSWDLLHEPTEPDLLGVVAHFMSCSEYSLSIPFIQFGDGSSSYGRRHAHPRLSLSLRERMFLANADTYYLDCTELCDEDAAKSTTQIDNLCRQIYARRTQTEDAETAGSNHELSQASAASLEDLSQSQELAATYVDPLADFVLEVRDEARQGLDDEEQPDCEDVDLACVEDDFRPWGEGGGRRPRGRKNWS